ncbi:hypothetical protein VULLAG_LOCUS13338 [Vulpes lagopus]
MVDIFVIFQDVEQEGETLKAGYLVDRLLQPSHLPLLTGLLISRKNTSPNTTEDKFLEVEGRNVFKVVNTCCQVAFQKHVPIIPATSCIGEEPFDSVIAATPRAGGGASVQSSPVFLALQAASKSRRL